MQSLLNKELIQKKHKKQRDIISIISPRVELSASISEQIRLSGIKRVKEIHANIFNTPTITLPDLVCGVVIDIADNKDIEHIINLIKSQVPRECWCILVGDNDSISTAQKFIERGIIYLHARYQITELAQRLMNDIPVDTGRKAFVISVLGCRGGAGTTLLSYQLTHTITQFKKVSTLFAQGNLGSQDLDLITEKKINHEIVSYQKNIDLMFLHESSLTQIDKETNGKYNFIVFDQTINNTERERIEKYIEHSNCIILLLDNSMTSVRIAKNFITIYDRFKRDNQTSVRMLTCINENRPITKDMLVFADIESLLGKPINVMIPYMKDSLYSMHTKTHYSRKKTHLLKLTKMVLGIEGNNKYISNSWINKIMKINK